jgi:hypothetical protein
VKRYRVYKQEFKHKISFFVLPEYTTKTYIPKDTKLVGFIRASSRDGASDMVKALTESGLTSNPALSH